MSEKTSIEWTQSTWNPVTGCTKLSAGCDHCYAERFSERFRGVAGHPYEMGFDLTLRPERLEQPMRWRRPRLIFVNSMSDLFHKRVPTEFVASVFETMETANWHVYQVLTKRSSLMRNFVNRRYAAQPVPSHIWLGTSIENAATMGRLRHLKQTNASVRFVSFEPLLGSLGTPDLTGIHWVIAGGESGPGAREVAAEWLREIRSACQTHAVAFFFKQWGGRTPKGRGNVLDGRQWLQYPNSGTVERLKQPLLAAGAPAEDKTDTEPMEVGPWVQEKLGCLEKYLDAYTKILRKQSFNGYFYIDAFAGPGSLKVRMKRTGDSVQQSLLEVSEYGSSDAGRTEYIQGSPRVALGIKHPFTDYVFLEIDDKRVQRLEDLRKEFEGKDTRIHIRKQNCNVYLRSLLERNRGQWHRWRGVVFLDPFGMHVPWSTVSELGRTGAIEVFINFPVGMAIQRLLKRSGEFSSRERAKLDDYFGTDEWFNLLYQSDSGLFGETVTTKVDNAGDRLVRWYRGRLRNAFGHVTTAREVRSTSGRPLYYLIFAGPNKTGAVIAQNVLKQGTRTIR